MPHKQKPQAILDRYRAVVDAEIRRLMAEQPDDLLQLMIRYHLGHVDTEGRHVAVSAGKRVRSALCLLTCEAIGGDPQLAAPAAAALELAHSFTLLHDDIADRDEMRRGRPTVWKLWGVAQAITAGDALHALADIALQNLIPRIPPPVVVSSIRELNQAILEVCEGQQLDISYEGRTDISLADYLGMIALKTGALFRAACGIGAAIAGAPESAIEEFRQFGSALGAIYQIRDDILGLWGEPSRTGKAVGSDLQRNKRSLPIVLALSAEEASPRAQLAGRLAQGITPEEAASLAAEWADKGIQEECRKLLGELLNSAICERLARMNLQPEHKDELRAIAHYLAERDE